MRLIMVRCASGLERLLLKMENRVSWVIILIGRILNGNVSCSFHAEMAALNKFNNLNKHKSDSYVRRKIKKFTLYVGSAGENSKPCSDCLKQINYFGIQKIYYMEDRKISKLQPGDTNRPSHCNLKSSHTRFAYFR